MKKELPKTVSQYIKESPAETQKKLREMRACVRAAAPGSIEGIKWRMPSYSYERILVMFAAFKHHIGLYPTAAAVKAFKKDLKKFKTAKGSIQFPLADPLPLPLIRKIVKYRVNESKKPDALWRSKKTK